MSDPNKKNPEPEPALGQCPECGLIAVPSMVRGMDLTSFAITEARCPLCLLNLLVKLAPALKPFTPPSLEETDEEHCN